MVPEMYADTVHNKESSVLKQCLACGQHVVHNRLFHFYHFHYITTVSTHPERRGIQDASCVGPGKSNLPLELRRKAGDCSRVTAGPIDLI